MTSLRPFKTPPRIDPFSQSSNFAELLERLLDGVVVFDKHRRVKAFNHGYAKLFSLGDSDIRVGDPLEHVLYRIAAICGLGDDSVDVDRSIARRLKSWGRRDDRFERRRLRDGRVLEVYRSNTSEGDVVCVHIDVTDRVRGEEELEIQRGYMASILENISDGVTLVDPDGRFIAFNRRFLELYDADPDRVPWGLPFHEMARHFGDLDGLTPEMRADAIEKRRIFATSPEQKHIVRNLFNGRTLDIVKSMLPGGGCVMTLHDITAQLSASRALEEERRRAEEANIVKSRFLGRMSHEMRTPLNGILGIAALAENATDDPKMTEYLSIIRSSGTMLLRLIDDVLDMTRVEAETFDLVAEPFSLQDILTETAQLSRPEAERKGLELRTSVETSGLPRVIGDPVRLKQVLMNLVANALKFTQAGAVHLNLTGRVEGERADVKLCVCDTGIGISPEDQARIFTQFYQVEECHTRQRGGVGLGLAICEKLVESMDGEISIASTLGKGSQFTVTLSLPLAADHLIPEGDGEPGLS